MLIGCNGNGHSVFSLGKLHHKSQLLYLRLSTLLQYNTYWVLFYKKKCPSFQSSLANLAWMCMEVFWVGGGTTPGNLCHLWKYKSHVETAHKLSLRVSEEISWQFDRDFKQFHGLQYLWTTYIFYCVLQYLNISSNSEEKVRFKTYFEELKVSE